MRVSSSCSDGRNRDGRICGGEYKFLIGRTPLSTTNSVFLLVSCCSRLRPASSEPAAGLGCPKPENIKLPDGVALGKLLLFIGDGICVLKGLGVVGRITEPVLDNVLVDVAEAAGRGKKKELLEQSMSSFHWQTVLAWSNKVPFGQANDLFRPDEDPSAMQMWNVRHPFITSA